jgi:L-alanine-DL-glutamate epimerase-like enolase superfamily enzyme
VQNAVEAHLAASLPNWKPPGEMNGYLKMAKDIGSPIRFENGALKLDATPGLGVNLLPQEIKELAVA